MNMNNEMIVILFALYFLQGIPYGIQSRFLPVYLRQHGMNLTNISFMKILFVPWICKALWALLFDALEAKRSWLIWSMRGLAAFTFALCFTGQQNTWLMTILFFATNMCASTQDIAVDGLAIRILSRSEVAVGNIAQVVGYKAGSIVGGGVLLWFSSFVTWSKLFMILSLFYVIIILWSTWSLPRNVFSKGSKMVVQNSSLSSIIYRQNPEDDYIQQSISGYVNRIMLLTQQKIVNLIRMPGTIWIMTFVILYKIGEQACLSMFPLFLIDRKMSLANVGLWAGMMADTFSIIGSLFAGWLISSRKTRCHILICILCILRVVPIFCAYLIVLTWPSYPQLTSLFNVMSIATMNVMLLFSGMITTATFTMMMLCSQRVPQNEQSSHYALLTTLEILGKLSFSLTTGFIVDTVGYAPAFLAFVVLSTLTFPLLRNMPPY